MMSKWCLIFVKINWIVATLNWVDKIVAKFSCDWSAWYSECTSKLFSYCFAVMACLNTLKLEIKTLEKIFTKNHERFRILNASVDELTCRFVGKGGKLYDIHANITVSANQVFILFIILWPRLNSWWNIFAQNFTNIAVVNIVFFFWQPQFAICKNYVYVHVPLYSVESIHLVALTMRFLFIIFI